MDISQPFQPLEGPPVKSRGEKLRHQIFGAPRRIEERSLFHSIALVPFLAWVGLGGDGLSSSAYGPDEAFRALGAHHYLALPLALAVALTVLLISACYMRVIERFPGGGGGYVVATKLLGPRVGVTAACALLVDYVLTVAVSISAGADAIFSMLPVHLSALKLPLALVTILALIVLNIRGLKESVSVLVPIFLVFVATHVALIVVGVFGNLDHAAASMARAHVDATQDIATIGWAGIIALLARAYSMGAGTFTGIEAVSNGLPLLREPRVENGKRTMVYMGLSLAFTAVGILICYLLANVVPIDGKTLNASLAERVFHGTVDGPWWGRALVGITLAAEGALLFVAAQTGFMGGPRVMANMAKDSWMPSSFALLSERLTTQNGVILMGAAAASIMFATGGDTHALVVMYSINVFLVFTITTLGMFRDAWLRQKARPSMRWHMLLHGVGFLVCLGILLVTVVEKFGSGGWLTAIITGSLVLMCFATKRQYDRVTVEVRKLDRELTCMALESERKPYAKMDADRPTAVVLVGGFGGLGMHTMMSVIKTFPNHFQQMVFVGVAVVDAHVLRDHETVEASKARTQGALLRYVQMARRCGVDASFAMGVDTEVVAEAVHQCEKLAEKFTNLVIFGGKLVFRSERFYHPILHNESAFAIQRRLQWRGVPMLVMPIRLQNV